MTTTCTSCGDAFTPAPDAYRRGTWRACARCRGDPGDEAPESPRLIPAPLPRSWSLRLVR
jgi:hypothetical protein